MNDALAAAGRLHRKLFEELGYEYVDVDFANPDASLSLNRAVERQDVEFAYSCVGMGADIRGTTSDGKEVNFWQANRIPFISLNGDSPAYFFDRHVMPTPWHACLYFFPEHLELRKRLNPDSALYALVPPVPFDLAERSEIDFRQKEGGKLLFLKNGNDPEKLVGIWRNALPATTFLMLADIASELAARIGTNADCDIDASVCEYFLNRGFDLGAFARLRLFFVAQLDDYLRRIKSTLVADTIADFPVEIHGFNWEHMDFSERRAKYIPGGDYTESRKWIMDSLGIIDMSPNTSRAPHDRAMRAFGLYTLCLTNEQRFFKEYFTSSDQFTYRFEKEHLREQVARILSHPKQYVEVGVAAAEEFRRTHSPADFSAFMLETADVIRLACGPRPPGLQDFFAWPSAHC